VGFSYSNVESDYNTGDNRTAHDNYLALQQWFKMFTTYQKRPFYIAGESYGGHYVPQLANQVVDGNRDTNNIHINLQGIMVGNGVTVNQLDLNSFMDIYGYHALIPWAMYLRVKKTCGGEYNAFVSNQCNELVTEAENSIGNIDPYDIYAPICTSSSKKGYNPIRFPHAGLREKFDPCIDLHLTEYLNRADVRAAIHADAAAGVWDECSNNINYNFTYANGQDITSYYMKFFKDAPNLRILIYSGDVDSIISFLGTEQWIDYLHRPVIEKWRPWLYNKNVGGYVQIHDKLTFITIRGAGHMVPYFRPALGYAFFERYITGKPF